MERSTAKHIELTSAAGPSLSRARPCFSSIEPESEPSLPYEARAKSSAPRAIAASGKSCASDSKPGPGIAGDFPRTKPSRILDRSTLLGQPCRSPARAPISELFCNAPCIHSKAVRTMPGFRPIAIWPPAGARPPKDFKANSENFPLSRRWSSCLLSCRACLQAGLIEQQLDTTHRSRIFGGRAAS